MGAGSDLRWQCHQLDSFPVRSQFLQVYESDPLPAGPPADGKFFGNFPYPYMNGRLHLGHTFALSKCEFYVRFQRMLGKQTLLPFGFHVTGMPIQASADKLRYELATYGNPPVFPVEEAVEVAETEDVDGEAAANLEPDLEGKEQKKAGVKTKTLMKTGGQRYQWRILEDMGVPVGEIHKFADPIHWLYYFPQLGMQDLK